MSTRRPKAQTARLLQAPRNGPMSRQQLILALRRMTMPLPRDPAIDPAFYEFAEVFRETVGPRLLEMAADLETQEVRKGRQDTEMGSDGKEHALLRDKFYIPGSLLKVNVDNTNPLAYGMPAQVDVFFDSSPVMKLEPDSTLKHTSAVAWFSGTNVLDSGWAWGQQYLDGGTAVADASVGEGKVVLLGPEVAFRAQPHATFKLLFNGLYYGSATEATLP